PLHHDGRRERHRDAVVPRLPPERDPGEPRHRIGRVGPALPDGGADRVHLHQGLQDGPVAGQGGYVMSGRKGSNWWTFWGVLILVWAAFPLLWMVSLSFKDPDTFREGTPTFFPQQWSWSNFKTVFSDELFTSALRNSFGIAIIATLLSVIVA